MILNLKIQKKRKKNRECDTESVSHKSDKVKTFIRKHYCVRNRAVRRELDNLVSCAAGVL